MTGSIHTQPDPAWAALLTIDVQRDFTLPGAPLEIAGTLEALPAMAKLVEAFREVGRPIVHVVRLYHPDGSNADLPRREAIESGHKWIVPGSDGAELMDDLKPSPALHLDAERLLAGEMQQAGDSEWLMFKPRWGAFYATSLEMHLRGLGVDTVVISGCNFPNCPRTTIYEASERDFKIVFVTDAISGVYEKGLTEMSNIGCALMTAAQCTAWLRAATARKIE
jgi:nicotinamidase-related amidase